MKKTPGNSKLKTLDPEVQRALFDACNAGTLQDGCRWLKQDHGVVVSAATLSRWCSWYGVTRTFREADEAATHYQEFLKETISDMTPEQLAEEGTKAFLALQIKTGDAKGFKRSLDGLGGLRRLKVSQQRLELLLEKLAETKKILDTPENAVTTKERLKKLYGREDA